jgi:hypothetical protein
MARTLSRKETVNEYGAPSSKMKALQEIMDEAASSLLLSTQS